MVSSIGCIGRRIHNRYVLAVEGVYPTTGVNKGSSSNDSAHISIVDALSI